MDQNVSKQKNPAKPTNSPAQKSTTSLGLLHHHSTPQGSTTCHIFPILAPWSALACWLLPVMASSPRRQRSPVGRGSRRVSSCWLLREGGRFCVVEVVCENHPSKKNHPFIWSTKKKVAGPSQILWSVIAHHPQDYPPPPRCCVTAFATKKGNNSTFPSQHFISS